MEKHVAQLLLDIQNIIIDDDISRFHKIIPMYGTPAFKWSYHYLIRMAIRSQATQIFEWMVSQPEIDINPKEGERGEIALLVALHTGKFDQVEKIIAHPSFNPHQFENMSFLMSLNSVKPQPLSVDHPYFQAVLSYFERYPLNEMHSPHFTRYLAKLCTIDEPCFNALQDCYKQRLKEQGLAQQSLLKVFTTSNPGLNDLSENMLAQPVKAYLLKLLSKEDVKNIVNIAMQACATRTSLGIAFASENQQDIQKILEAFAINPPALKQLFNDTPFFLAHFNVANLIFLQEKGFDIWWEFSENVRNSSAVECIIFKLADADNPSDVRKEAIKYLIDHHGNAISSMVARKQINLDEHPFVKSYLQLKYLQKTMPSAQGSSKKMKI